MKLSKNVRSITYLKANAADLVDTLTEEREPYVITQNGEAKAVIVDVATWEQTEETLALLKILALGNNQIAEGKTRQAADVIKELRRSITSGR
jgi:prevent-host-death family protein